MGRSSASLKRSGGMGYPVLDRHILAAEYIYLMHQHVYESQVVLHLETNHSYLDIA